MRTKRAAYVVKAVEVNCPHCGVEIPNAYGSLYWTTDELDEHGTQPLQCSSCGKHSAPPVVKQPH